MLIEETSLITQAKLGDKEAFSKLIKNSYGKLSRFVNSRFGFHPDNEDIIQETLIKAYKHIGTFKGFSSFYTWLCKIAKQLIWRKQRGYKLSFCQINPNLTWTGKSPDEVIEFNELQSVFNKFISFFPSRQKTVLYLRLMEGMSISDISEQTGVSRDAVKKAFQRASKKWKKSLLPKILEGYGQPTTRRYPLAIQRRINQRTNP